MNRITAIFIKLIKDILDLSEGESSRVSATNTGMVASGLITENKGGKTKMNNSNIFCHKGSLAK